MKSRERDSSIELLRIVAMFLIVLHHFVDSSGIIDLVTPGNCLETKNVITLFFGIGGKIGLNCFVIITGYFMVKSQATIHKFLKILLEIQFYGIVLYAFLVICNYVPFSLKQLFYVLIPISDMQHNFNSAYLMLYLLIPYINISLNQLTKKQYKCMLAILLSIDVLIPTLLRLPEPFHYLGLFILLYALGGYCRLHISSEIDNKTNSRRLLLADLIILVITTYIGIVFYSKTGQIWHYYLVLDANKLLAVTTALLLFMTFKNWKIGYSKCINYVARATFAAMLLHACFVDWAYFFWENIVPAKRIYDSISFYWLAPVVSLLIIIAAAPIDWIRTITVEKWAMKLLSQWCNDK